jgi:hypothetical protein
MTDETLLLRIRAETLQASLDTIGAFLKETRTRQGHLHSIEKQLADIRKLASDIQRDVDSLQIAAEDSAAEDDEKRVLKECVERISSLRSHLKQTLRDVKEIQQMCFHVDDPIWSRASEYLRERIVGPLLQLRQVKHMLENKLPIDAAVWSNFRDKAVMPSQSFFNEYFDLLGGIALRDARFDAGICQVADELIRTYPSNPQNEDRLRAIPAREETVMALARLIRLRFPKWTIWALPFTAHEFWNINARQRFHEFLAGEIAFITKGHAPAPKIEPRFQECLADAFATYMMGPAYAYAAIILLLDPYASFVRGPEEPANAVRVHVILKMLEQMDSKSSGIDLLYADVRAHLKTAWQAAVEQTGPPANDEQMQQISADTKHAEILVQALWNVLEKNTSGPLTVEAWNDVRSWKEALLEGKEHALPAGAELCHGLNAAWLARVDPARDPKIDLTEATLKIASTIIESKKNPIRGEDGRDRRTDTVTAA